MKNSTSLHERASVAQKLKQKLLYQNYRYLNPETRIKNESRSKVFLKWASSKADIVGPKRFQNLINIDQVVYGLKNIGGVYNNKKNINFIGSLRYYEIDAILLHARIKLVTTEYDSSIDLLKKCAIKLNKYQELKFVFEPLLHILLVLNYKFKQDKNNAEFYLGKFNATINQINNEGVQLNGALLNKINVLLNDGDVSDDKNPFLPKHLKGRDLEFITQVVNLIDRHMENEALSVCLLNQELNLSHSQMYRKVLALTSFTVAELIRIVKLHRAKYRLENKLGTISEIASQICYTRSHFSRAFSKQFGYPPKALL